MHGSALFERGETQILGVTTLNMLRMEQQLDTLAPETRKRYMHNYNFPPYSTGETGRVGSPKRREIGHGALAERALLPVLPAREEFPYAIRQVSEALGSNGSTSMGSVCASTMSLLNAGVPLRAPVAGIAMGLISDTVDGQTEYVALTDILGAEDAFGDMDFKVAGTKDFVTALQLDTKLDGIPASVLGQALTQARDARLTILEVMAEAIDGPDEMSPFAPRIITMKIPVDQIGAVIGPKGKMINQIQDDSGAEITIEDDGTIFIGATDGLKAEAARTMINGIANPQMPEKGERYLGTVVKTTTFGAFVSLMPGRDGLLHISQLRKMAGGKRVENVEDVVKVGDKVQVEIAEVDPRGKLSLVPVHRGLGERRRARRRRSGRRPVHRSRPAPQPTPELTTRTLLSEVDGGLVRRTVLPGGLRVVTEAMPTVRSVTFGIWVGVGSRDESVRQAGLLALPRAPAVQGHPSGARALEISSAVDRVGGEMNAFTAKEYTCFYARVLDSDLPVAVDVVSDVVNSALLLDADVESERGVILEEIAMSDDDPADLVHDAFAQAVFGDTPLGRPVLGTVDSIEGLARRTIDGYYRRHYRPENMVVAAAGNLDHASVVRLVRKAFRAAGLLGEDARPRRCRRAPEARRPRGRRRPASCVQSPPDRAGQLRARRARADPAPRRPAVRARRAQRRARRRHVEPAVPGGPREARAGVLGLLVQHAVRRHRAVRRLRRLHARSASTRCSSCAASSWRRSSRARHHRRGAAPRPGAAARGAGARPGGHRVADEPDRQGRARLRRAAGRVRAARAGSTR